MIATTVQNRNWRSLEQEGAKPRLSARPARKPRRGWRPQAEFLEGRELLNSVVSVATEMAQASEIGPTPAIFSFTRTGDLSSPLQANFSLGGTAQSGVDYQVMDKTASFDAGSSTAYVTVMPINVTGQKTNETVTLTLVPGAGYTVGTAASATATIADAYVQGLSGVFNLPNPYLPVGFSPDPRLPVRMTYLQAKTQGGYLQIAFGLVSTGLEPANVEIYLNTDQNPLTGDQRIHHVGGQEYRVDVPLVGGVNGEYYLCPLPSTPGQTQLSLPPSNPYLGLGPDQPSATGGVTYLGSGYLGSYYVGGLYVLSIPLSQIGNRAAVDVFAFTYGASDGSQAQGEGDRVPKFGAIDTTTGKVVVRDPVRTRINTVTNVGQASAGSPYYITTASFASIVDQFFTSLSFSRPIGSDGTLVGQLDLDSDRSLDTGEIPMRGAIQDGTGVPSFGGDTSLWFRLGGIEGAMVHLEHDQSYDPFNDPDAVFGGQDNDGRWVYSGSTLTLVSSISTFDPFQITFKDPLTEASTRFSTYPNQGDMYARCTLTDELGTVTYDSLPRGLGSGVVDTATGQVVAPLTLDQNQNRWVAPPSPVGILAAPDFIEVDAEVVGGNLVVKGVLEQLPSRDIGTEYAIYLDTSPSGGFVPDYEVTITTDEGYTGFIRSATLISPDGSASGHDTWVNVDAHDVDDFDSSGQPVHGSFTVTIPLNELKNVGPKLDLYVASLDTVADPGFVYDVAPHDKNGNISPPLEVDTGNEPTVVTPASTYPSPAPNAVTTPNWSGYVAATSISQPKANSVTAVSGSWIVPTVTGPSTGSYYSSVWVGIDGWGNSTVEQLGTEEDLVNGSPVYRAWWEMYSSGKGQPEQVITSMNVMPGDSITASVQYITSGAHAGQFYLSIVDNSRANDAFSIYASSSQYQSPLAQLSCAEWIVEAPTVGGSIATVPNFGSVTFTNATAVINGVSGPINAASWQSQALNIGSNGVTYDTTSVLTNSGTSFVVTYNPSAGAAVRAGTNAAARTVSGAAVGTTLRSGKTVAGPVLRGSAWTGASVVSGFRTPVRQHKRPTQGFVIDPLWN